MKTQKSMAGMLSCFLFCSLISFSSVAQYKGDTWEEIKKKGSGTVTFFYYDIPGFAFKDAAGNPAGICVEIMNNFINYVESTKNVKIDVKYVGQADDFKSFYSKFKSSSGGVFGLGNITITDARKKEVKFTPPYISNINVLLTHKEVPTLGHISEAKSIFKDFKAYNVKGTANEKHIVEMKDKYLPALEILQVPVSQQAIDKIVEDKKSFTILDFIHYSNALKNKLPIKRHPVGDKVIEKFGMMMPMNSDWDTLVNEFFTKDGGLTNQAEYKKIIFKHLGPDIMKMLKEADGKNS
jgi:ABC-type amino acid transport substrate-binding protein